jgi:hypothetical protein
LPAAWWNPAYAYPSADKGYDNNSAVNGSGGYESASGGYGGGSGGYNGASGGYSSSCIVTTLEYDAAGTMIGQKREDACLAPVQY